MAKPCSRVFKMLRVYRTWIDGARVYVTAQTRRDAVQLARALEGWNTTHSMSWEPRMRGTAPGLLIIAD